MPNPWTTNNKGKLTVANSGNDRRPKQQQPGIDP
jgi:hypothetical protein